MGIVVPIKNLILMRGFKWNSTRRVNREKLCVMRAGSVLIRFFRRDSVRLYLTTSRKSRLD